MTNPDEEQLPKETDQTSRKITISCLIRTCFLPFYSPNHPTNYRTEVQTCDLFTTFESVKDLTLCELNLNFFEGNDVQISQSEKTVR